MSRLEAFWHLKGRGMEVSLQNTNDWWLGDPQNDGGLEICP